MLFRSHGKAVSEEIYRTSEEALEAVLSHVRVLGETDGQYETAALLFMTQHEAYKAYEYFKRLRIDVCYINRDSQSFERGLTVTAYYMAKGLEFDQVFIMGGSKENGMFKNFRYISATRALHELYVCDIVEESME